MKLGDIVDLPDGSAYDTESGLMIDANGVVYDATTTDNVASQVAATNDPGILQQILQAAPQALAFMNAYQLSQVNIDRARRGMQPLNTAAYGPRVGVSLDAGTQKMIMLGIIALAAVFLLKNRG